MLTWATVGGGVPIATLPEEGSGLIDLRSRRSHVAVPRVPTIP
jgi:hypothetical protein